MNKRWFNRFENPDSIVQYELINGDKVERDIYKKIELEDEVVKLMIKLTASSWRSRTVKLQKKNWKRVFFTLKMFRQNFRALQCVIFSYLNVTAKAHGTLIRVLLRTAPYLEEMQFGDCLLSETLFTKLLIHLREIKNKRLNFKFIEIYRNSISFLRQHRLFYIMSLVSTYTDDFFHTQTDSTTNHLAYKPFYRAADILSRKSLKGKIYLGASKRHPEERTEELNKYLVPLNVIIHENPWTIVTK